MISINDKLDVLSHSAKLLAMLQKNLIQVGITDETGDTDSGSEESLFKSLGSAEALLLRHFYQLALDEGQITQVEVDDEDEDEDELEWERRLTA